MQLSRVFTPSSWVPGVGVGGRVPSEQGDSTDVSTGAVEGQAHWSYADAESWGEHDPEWAACGSQADSEEKRNARRQSPIDINLEDKTADSKLAKLAFDYKPLPLVILNNGHTIQAQGDDRSTLDAGGKTYKLVQMHFHSSSEHTLSGRHSPLELHLVHQSADKKEYAVVGLLLVEGEENAQLAPIFANAPKDRAQRNAYQTTSICPSSSRASRHMRPIRARSRRRRAQKR